MAPITLRTFTPELVVSKAASIISMILQRRLAKGNVLLLLSGGSAIEMYRQACSELVAQKIDASVLTVSLFDERFVPASSNDSNAKQLTDAGVIGQFTELHAKWLPYLSGQVSGAQVAQQVSEQFSLALQQGSQLMILAGLGDDGHTAGLLPTQDAQTIHDVFESSQLVKYYELPTDTQNPYRQRITATPSLISKATEIIIYATGPKKQPFIKKFIDEDGDVPSFPALSLKTAAEVSLITDQEL